jgi:hypothetical protein
MLAAIYIYCTLLGGKCSKTDMHTKNHRMRVFRVILKGSLCSLVIIEIEFL